MNLNDQRERHAYVYCFDDNFPTNHKLTIDFDYFSLLSVAEIEKQLNASRPKVIFCNPDIYATAKQAALNTKSNIKIVCIKTAADEIIPDGAIDFAQMADINSKLST